MKLERQHRLMLYLTEHQSASMEELMNHFGVSMNTVRRDVAALVASGDAEKVYGGVRVARKISGFIPYEQRSLRPSLAKQAICRKAAELVNDGDTIFIDSGTTTIHLIDALADRHVTVITNNMEVIARAMNYPSIQLIVLPGELDRQAHAVTGDTSADYLSRFSTNIAFMAATGISKSGVTNSIPLEYSIKQAAVAHTDRAVLMVTGNKFGITSLMNYAALDAFHCIITDPRIPKNWLDQLLAMDIRVEVAVPDSRH
ncbi:MAG: DeoR/GlpR transcriptional regulator [Clostridia bacterium]|nr:DeoR/GlpR transcriptional regulator [Clostridia bacterium]